jgi:hypothetical protein
MQTTLRTLVVLWLALAVATAVPSVGNAKARAFGCANVLGSASVTGPTSTVAWRAEIEARTAVFDRPTW